MFHYAYTYKLELKLARIHTHLNLITKSTYIEQCVNEYNKTSLQMYTPKRITLIQITQDSIFLNLESTTELTAVGKSLRTFSILLLRDDDFSCAVSSNGQLLRVIQLSCEENPASTCISTANIDDLTFLKALLDYVYQPRDLNTTIYKRKKAAFEQMKQLALDADFYSNS